MSSAGMLVVNDRGNIVIDSELKNLALRYKGYVTESQGSPPRNANSVSVAYRKSFKVQMNVRNPVVAVRPDQSSGPATPVSDWSSAGNIVLLSHMKPLGGDLYEAEFWYSGSFTYYVFDEPQPANDTGSAGMRVWNDKGELCFSSSFQYMRISSTFVGDFDAQGDFRGVNHVAETPGKSFALVQSKIHMQTSKLAEPVAHQTYGILTKNSFVIRSSGFGIGVVMGTTDFGGYNYSNNYVIPGLGSLLRGMNLVVDVTGY